MPKVRVLLVDDRILVRLGMKSILADQADIEVVGEAGDFEEATELVRRLKPTVVIVDASAQALDVVGLTEKILAQTVPPRGILLLANSQDQRVISAIESGANGLLLKHSQPAQLIAAVRMVAAGYYLLAPLSYDRDIPNGSPAPPPRILQKEQLEPLTSRELDVFRLVSQGWSNAEISRTLSLGESTVKAHIRSILLKLGLRNRIHIVIFAYRIGLFPVAARPQPQYPDVSGIGRSEESA